MEYKKALMDFLVYSYFEIIPECIYNESEYYKNHKDYYNDYCTKMVIIKAYSDATNEGAYNTLFKKEIPNIDELKKSSDEAKKKSAKLLLDRLKTLEKTIAFDNWHNNLCRAIVDNYSKVKIEKQEFFTYGNAQKWVNMTLKYLWLLGILPDCIKEENLHIPVDSFIIDALWKNKDITLPLKSGNKKQRDSSYSQPSNYVNPWSQWEYGKDYKPFRNSIQETNYNYNLSWENKEWIKMSELRKHKEQDKKYTGFFGE